MKLYISQIEQLVRAISSGQVRAMLLYGPDKGYISKICELVIAKFSLLPTTRKYDGLNAQALSVMLNSQNFFGKKEFIKITDVTNKLDANLESILQKDNLHFLTFVADEMPATSKLRKLFEQEKYLASIGCYPDDETAVGKIVLRTFVSANKKIENDALKYLQTHLRGDRKLIDNELQKLLAFAYDKDNISLLDVTEVISSDLVAEADELCIAFAKGNDSKFLYEFNKLIEQDINIILILRKLMNYYMNLYIVISKVAMGEDTDSAIRALSPPIFFKFVPQFKQIANQLTSRTALHALEILNQAEIDFKLKPHSFDFYHQVYLKVHKPSSR